MKERLKIWERRVSLLKAFSCLFFLPSLLLMLPQGRGKEWIQRAAFQLWPSCMWLESEQGCTKGLESPRCVLPSSCRSSGWSSLGAAFIYTSHVWSKNTGKLRICTAVASRLPSTFPATLAAIKGWCRKPSASCVLPETHLSPGRDWDPSGDSQQLLAQNVPVL